MKAYASRNSFDDVPLIPSLCHHSHSHCCLQTSSDSGVPTWRGFPCNTRSSFVWLTHPRILTLNTQSWRLAATFSNTRQWDQVMDWLPSAWHTCIRLTKQDGCTVCLFLASHLLKSLTVSRCHVGFKALWNEDKGAKLVEIKASFDLNSNTFRLRKDWLCQNE